MPIDFPANPTNGQVYSNWIYDSSITSWRNVNTDTGVAALNTMGLRNILPTSVDVGSGSATTNANGFVQFSGVTSISLNNVFSSTYDSYKILFRTTNAGANAVSPRLRLRASGSDNSASQYSFAVPLVSNAGNFTSYTGTNLTYFDLGNASVNLSGYNEISISKPNVSSSWTSMNWTTFSHSSSNFFGGGGGGFHSVNYAATGFTIFASTSNITGTVQVYGYTN
jgi:hypothetical protein